MSCTVPPPVKGSLKTFKGDAVRIRQNETKVSEDGKLQKYILASNDELNIGSWDSVRGSSTLTVLAKA